MEPTIGAAAMAGAASAGKSLKEAGVLKALLLPAAKAYGDHWGKQAEERIAAAVEAKRRRNVAAHLEAVEERMDATADPDPEIFKTWIEGAARIDPADDDLAAAWRGVFEAIATGDVYRARMMEVVKSLTPDEAHALLHLNRMRNRLWPDSMGLDYHKRFRDLGLIEKPFAVLIRLLVLMLPSGVAVGIAAVALAYIGGVPSALFEAAKSTASGRAIVAVASMFFLVLMALLTIRAFMSTHLTPFGVALMRRALAYKGWKQPGS